MISTHGRSPSLGLPLIEVWFEHSVLAILILCILLILIPTILILLIDLGVLSSRKVGLLLWGVSYCIERLGRTGVLMSHKFVKCRIPYLCWTALLHLMLFKYSSIIRYFKRLGKVHFFHRFAFKSLHFIPEFRLSNTVVTIVKDWWDKVWLVIFYSWRRISIEKRISIYEILQNIVTNGIINILAISFDFPEIVEIFTAQCPDFQIPLQINLLNKPSLLL